MIGRRRLLSALAGPSGSSPEPDVPAHREVDEHRRVEEMDRGNGDRAVDIPDERYAPKVTSQQEPGEDHEEERIIVPVGELTRAAVEHRKQLAEAAPDVTKVVRSAVIATARGLMQAGYTGKTEVNAFAAACLARFSAGSPPEDSLEAWIKEHGGNGEDAGYDRASNTLAERMQETVVKLDFALALPVPVRLYSSYPQVRELMAALMCPVVHESENGRYATIASFNPHAVLVAENAYRDAYAAKTGWIPYVTPVRVSRSEWKELVDMHFDSQGRSSNGH